MKIAVEEIEDNKQKIKLQNKKNRKKRLLKELFPDAQMQI